MEEHSDTYQWDSRVDDDRPDAVRENARTSAPVHVRKVSMLEIWTRLLHKDIRKTLIPYFHKPQRNSWQQTPECWIYTKRNPKMKSFGRVPAKVPQAVRRQDGKGARRDYPAYGYFVFEDDPLDERDAKDLPKNVLRNKSTDYLENISFLQRLKSETWVAKIVPLKNGCSVEDDHGEIQDNETLSEVVENFHNVQRTTS